MAINYFEGTIGAGSTNPADDARIAIKTVVAGVSGWSVLDDGYTASSIARTVLKCEAATSGLPNDFYVILHNSTVASTQQLWVSVCEGYNSTTHTITYPQISGHATDSSCRSTSTPSLSSVGNQAWGSSSTGYNFASAIQASQSKMWAVCLFDDGIAIGAGNAATYLVYAGVFTSLIPSPSSNDPMPIALIPLNTTAGAQNYAYQVNLPVTFTRFAMNPNLAAGVPGDISSAGGKSATFIPQAIWVKGGVNTTAMYSIADPYINKTGLQTSPLLIINGTYSNGVTPAYGSIRGRIKNVLHVGDTNGAFGDTITVDGAVYTKLSNTTNYWIRKS